MLTALLPYLLHFSEELELDGLTLMQRRLTLEQGPGQVQGERDGIKPMTQFSFNIFKLLEEIGGFKYNINFREWDG